MKDLFIEVGDYNIPIDMYYLIIEGVHLPKIN
jgi:hypothetical protein